MLQLELFSLYAFALVLPMFEAPKNLLWVIYAALWIINRSRAKNFGGPWNAWDTLILSWVASGYLAAGFSGLHKSEWLSAFDVLRYGSVLWMLKRSGYDATTLNRLLVCLAVGTSAALFRGGYELWIAKAHANLGLNSVGHVNHSAIYVAIAFVATLAWLRATWSTAGSAARWAGVAVSALFTLSLFVMASRGAVGAGLLAAFAFLLVYAARSGKGIKTLIVVAVVAISGIYIAKPVVVEKNEARLKENLFLAYRDGIWRAGIEAWREYPIWGVGMGNYGLIDRPLVEKWSRERGVQIAPEKISFASHGHSLYVNTLSERGAGGFAVLLAVLIAWGWSLARHVPRPTSPPVRWAYWGGAFGALLVAVIVGLVNTTLHHEHALISMLLLGGWLALRDQAPEPR